MEDLPLEAVGVVARFVAASPEPVGQLEPLAAASSVLYVKLIATIQERVLSRLARWISTTNELGRRLTYVMWVPLRSSRRT